MYCWHCGRQIEVKEQVGFRDYCQCELALHVCRNCRFYDPGYHNQCREPQAERVVEKERANFCEYFSPSTVKPQPQVNAARAKFDALFKKH
ncbi:MAG: hypothetical protein ACREQ4_05895 [Candidatus Binataceae bacterium]